MSSKVAMLILAVLVAASNAVPFISLTAAPIPTPSAAPISIRPPPPNPLSQLLRNPFQLIHSKLLAPKAVAPQSTALLNHNLDALLQHKLNLILGVPVLRPLPATPATPDVIVAQPLASTKPFKPENEVAPSAADLAPKAVAPQSTALLPHNLDAFLQHKLNRILGVPARRPLPATPATPVVIAAQPLASTKPFKPENEVSPSVADVQSSSVPESASASANLLTSYGVPAAPLDVESPIDATLTLPLTGGPRHGRFSAVAEPNAAAVPASEQLYVSDDQQQYVSSYRLEDGTHVQEQGQFAPTGNGAEVAFIKHGRYEYVSPEGTPVRVNWVADQNGYRVLDN